MTLLKLIGSVLLSLLLAQITTDDQPTIHIARAAASASEEPLAARKSNEVTQSVGKVEKESLSAKLLLRA